jgi:hypothetical protein
VWVSVLEVGLGFGLGLGVEDEVVGFRVGDELEEEATDVDGRLVGGGVVRRVGVGAGREGGGGMTGWGMGGGAEETTMRLERDWDLVGRSGSGLGSSTGVSTCGAGILPPPREPSAAQAAM